MGKIIDGLADFYSIDSIEIFPKTLINHVIFPSLSSPLKDKLFEESFYIGAPDSRKCDDKEVSFLHTVPVDASNSDFLDLSDLGRYS